MTKIAYKIRVTGKVQGVFFRDSTRRLALQEHITGFANNRPDGSVEIVLQGEEERVENVVRWIKAGGPPAARVDNVEDEPCELTTHQGFTVG